MDSAELHGSTAKSDQISSNSAMMTSVLSSPTTSFSGNTRGITSETCLAVFPAFSVARNEEKTGGNLTGGPQVLASTGSQHVCHHSAHMGPSSSSMYRPQSDGNFYQYIGQLQEHMATTQNYQHATSPQRQYFGHTNTADQHQFANSQLSGFVNYQQSRMRQYVSRMSAPSPTSRDDCVVGEYFFRICGDHGRRGVFWKEAPWVARSKAACLLAKKLIAIPVSKVLRKCLRHLMRGWQRTLLSGPFC